MGNLKDSNASVGSVANKACPCATEEMLKIKKQYQDIVNRGKFVGASWAAKMLQHWMNGSGKDMIIKMEVLRNFSLIKNKEDEIREAIIKGIGKRKRDIVNKLKDGEEKIYFIFANRKITWLPWSELFYASGTSTLTGRIILKAKRVGDTVNIEGTLELHWWDPYDWHIGLDAYIPTIGTIKDSDADKYENAGCAKKFDMFSFWNQTFTYKYVTDAFMYFDDEDIVWGDITSGRVSQTERGSLLEWLNTNTREGVMNLDTYEVFPGLEKDKVEIENTEVSSPEERRDRRERTREDTRRDNRRRKR